MFRNVPACSGMFHVPPFIDAQNQFPTSETLGELGGGGGGGGPGGAFLGGSNKNQNKSLLPAGYWNGDAEYTNQDWLTNVFIKNVLQETDGELTSL